MSGIGVLWEPLCLSDDAFDLRVCQSVRTGELMRDLLRSKAMATRVLARGQLRRVGEPTAGTSGQDGPLAHHTCLEPGQAVSLSFWREGQGDEMRRARQVVTRAPRARCLPSTIAPDPSCTSWPDVRYEDPILLAADKPAGLLVHGDGTGAPTLTSQVRSLLADRGRPTRAQAVQRLDVDTTGLVLFSQTEEFQPALDELVAGHDLQKRYLAVVEGELSSTGGLHDGWLVLDHPIARDRHDARRMRVGRTGKPARTRVRALARHRGHSLLLVELDSGRRHQIRVHLAHVGMPLVGDTLYGGTSHADGLMLHAWQERFAHPATGEPLCLEALCPERFRRLFPGIDELLGDW